MNSSYCECGCYDQVATIDDNPILSLTFIGDTLYTTSTDFKNTKKLLSRICIKSVSNYGFGEAKINERPISTRIEFYDFDTVLVFYFHYKCPLKAVSYPYEFVQELINSIKKNKKH